MIHHGQLKEPTAAQVAEIERLMQPPPGAVRHIHDEFVVEVATPEALLELILSMQPQTEELT